MQNGEQPIRLPNGLLYPRVKVEQRTHSGEYSGDEIVSNRHSEMRLHLDNNNKH